MKEENPKINIPTNIFDGLKIDEVHQKIDNPDNQNPLLLKCMVSHIQRLNSFDENLISLSNSNFRIEKYIILVINFKKLKLNTHENLNTEYRYLKGYFDCANNLFALSDDEHSSLLKIVDSIYAESSKIVMMLTDENRIANSEKHGVDALVRLLKRNLNEYGSGSSTIKSFLLGLYNGNAYPVVLTDLRNLDRENFDDLMAVLNMNARCNPRKEIHEYLKNGQEIWQTMKNHFSSDSQSG
jgi:hypothetical protein